MINYTVYDGSSGRILRTGQAQPSTLPQLPLTDDEALILGTFDAERHYIHQGRALVRPNLPAVTPAGQSVEFAALPPDGTVAKLSGRFIDVEVPITEQILALVVPEQIEIEIVGPWPYVGLLIELDGTASGIPEGAQILVPDLDRMKSFFLQELRREQELSDAMLGSPDETTRSRWNLKRSIRDRYLAGTNSAADEEAMEASVRYSDLTVQQELDRIGAKVEFEDWAVMRAYGIHQEAERRLDVAVTPDETLDVLGWAETEIATALSEAQARLAATD